MLYSAPKRGSFKPNEPFFCRLMRFARSACLRQLPEGPKQQVPCENESRGRRGPFPRLRRPDPARSAKRVVPRIRGGAAMRAFGFKGLRQSKWFGRRSYKVAQYCLMTGAVLLGFSGCRAQETPLTHLTPPSQPIPASYFGLHIHRAAADTWPSIPFGEWRFWDAEGTAWYNLEPQPGKWDWTRLDRDVSLAEQHHVGIILTLGLVASVGLFATERPAGVEAGRSGAAAQRRGLEELRAYRGDALQGEDSCLRSLE